MRSFTVTGVHQDDGQFIPQLVVSKDVSKDVNLLNVHFETNPLGTYIIIYKNASRKIVAVCVFAGLVSGSYMLIKSDEDQITF